MSCVASLLIHLEKLTSLQSGVFERRFPVSHLLLFLSTFCIFYFAIVQY